LPAIINTLLELRYDLRLLNEKNWTGIDMKLVDLLMEFGVEKPPVEFRVLS
jgi:hypothetical protein